MSRLVSQQDFRNALSRLGAAVNIITTDGPAGRVGLTVSAACSVTDSPPTLLICLRRDSALRDIFISNGALCLNALSGGQERLSPLFAGVGDVGMDGRFASAAWNTMHTGAPALEGAAVNIDTKISDCVEVGTHSVMFCEVLSVNLSIDESALVYFARAYHHLGSPA